MRFPPRNSSVFYIGWSFFVFGIWPFLSSVFAANGELEIRIVDDQSGEPIAAQLQIRDRRGRVRPIRRTANWNRQYAVDGKAIVSLAPGRYTFTVSRGPEYLEHDGHFQIESAATDTSTIRMKRFTNLARQGWWSADLAISHAERDVDVWLRSADLHVASVQSYSFIGDWVPKFKTAFSSNWHSNGNHWFSMSAGSDNRKGGGALVLHGPQAFQVTDRPESNSASSSVEFLKLANRFDQSHICVARPNSWDLPIWLASGYVDSFMLLGPELRQDGQNVNDPPGLYRDPTFYPEPHGWGRFSQEIYYHLLNCGFRIPPVAGSGSGRTNNPVGYARTYVHGRSAADTSEALADNETLDIHAWWESLRAGRVMVTNGPLIIPQANGQLPGHVFRGAVGETVRLTPQLTLHTREKIEYLEIIKNGRVLHDVMLGDLVDKQGILPDIEFTASGWFLIRAVTKNKNYHAASTGPYYVEFDGRPRISTASVRFFTDWLDQQTERRVGNGATKKHKRFQAAAKKFWQRLAARASSEEPR